MHERTPVSLLVVQAFMIDDSDTMDDTKATARQVCLGTDCRASGPGGVIGGVMKFSVRSCDWSLILSSPALAKCQNEGKFSTRFEQEKLSGRVNMLAVMC